MMDNLRKFESGKGYWATSTLDKKKQIVVVALNDKDGAPVFARIREFGYVKQMFHMDGRDFAQIVFGDGMYCVSAAVPADVAEANKVMHAVMMK